MAKQKKIILSEKGEVKSVAPGFAAFLMRSGKALPYNQQNVESLAREKQKRAKASFLQAEEDRRNAEEIEGMVLSFFLNEEKGKVFGSITQLEVLKALEEKGVKLPEKRRIKGAFPFHTTGVHTVSVRLSETLNPELKLEVKVKSK